MPFDWKWKSLGLALLLVASNESLKATTFLEGDATWGLGYKGGGAKAALDFDKDATWNGEIEFTRANVIDPVNPDLSNQSVLNFDHTWAKAWDLQFGFSFTNDLTNKLTFGGPTLGLTYTFNQAEELVPAQSPQARARAESKPEAGGTEEADQAGEAEGENNEAPEPKEIFAFGLNSQVFYYSADLGPGFAFNKQGRLVFQADRKDQITNLYLEPNLEMPLFSGTVVPSAYAGRYFYSKDPTNLASILSGRLGGTVVGNKLNNLEGNLLWASWGAALTFNLPWDFTLYGSFGQQELVSPEVWSDAYEAYIEEIFLDHYRVKFDYNQSIQQGRLQLLYSLEVAYIF